MKIKSVLRTVAAAAVMATASLSASAGFVVLDGWQLITPAIPFGVASTTGIGRLNLISGTATVQQEVNGLGNAFVGAKFTESGVQFSVTYTPENVVGAGDSGSPSFLGDFLTITFGPVSGHVTALNPGGGFKYSFDSGSFSISGLGGPYAGGTVVGIGGNFGSTAVIGGINGDSTLLGAILGGAFKSLGGGFDILDKTIALGGVSLQSDLLAGNVLFEAVTNNNVTGVSGPVACAFTTAVAGDFCINASVGSGGDAFLVRVVPEPGSIALMGLGLLGLGAVRRRKASK